MEQTTGWHSFHPLRVVVWINLNIKSKTFAFYPSLAKTLCTPVG